MIKIKADNIKCDGCANTIKNGLSELPEIESVEVNIETGEVTVTASDIDQTTIEQKLSELGYPTK